MISILHNHSTKLFFKYYHFYILYKQDNIMHFNKLLDTTVKENSVQSQFTQITLYKTKKNNNNNNNKSCCLYQQAE